MVELLIGNPKEAARRTFTGKLRDQLRVVRKFIEADLTFNVEARKKEADKGSEVYRSVRFWVGVALVLAALLCAVMGFKIVVGVSRPIMVITETMRVCAGGDMAVELAGADQSDEIGKLTSAILMFKDNAHETSCALGRPRDRHD